MYLLHTVHAKAGVFSIHTFMHQKKQRDQTAANPKQAKHKDREPGARVYARHRQAAIYLQFWDKEDKKKKKKGTATTKIGMHAHITTTRTNTCCWCLG
jgi:hypothetical protein